jgi:hypothetical protein
MSMGWAIFTKDEMNNVIVGRILAPLRDYGK